MAAYLMRSLLLILQSGHFDVLRAEFSVLVQPPPNEAEGLKLQNWLLINSTPTY